MNLKKSLLIALFSFGIAQSAFAETNREKFDRAAQFYEQQNYSAAFPLFKQLAELGDAKAQFNLALMYANGQGVAQSDKQAAYWFEKAAEQGYAAAQFNLGLMYGNGKGVAQSDTQAAYWYEKAAEQEDAKAPFNLALMYYKGKGVRRDVSKAKQLFGQACDNGNSGGCNNYSILDEQGVR
ncbi:hypothetical protein X781_23570 [Mannheimia sp. USDA-ARS-USMARC-1261]|uniref:tetratricopeptide repeat protein n=1 Tax=Mannheimia sp. USDA-ARS-USMARC-1261 TaxID=1432056 RepID=UPI0003E3D15C|nr:tetratricopeptide repeat protein [Mannheimia sp. USDA-ARS-USMARC-1261]AHG74500.1 hypothetical protein X781_23570 [Mannheimia sp. USDA-ARS-USMARC-1261]